MWPCGLKTSMEACGVCSERVGRLAAPGAEGPRGQGGRAQQEAKPTVLCADPHISHVSPWLHSFQLRVSCRLDLCAPKTCWVAGLYVNFTRIRLKYTSASPQRSRLSSRRKVTQNVVSRHFSRKPAVSLDCLGSVDFSQSFQHVSVSQEPVFGEIFFFFLPIPKKCEILLHFFHTIWEDQIFFSDLWRY